MDYLSVLLQRDGLLRRGRARCWTSRSRRAPSTCASIAPRAQPDRLAPAVARHRRRWTSARSRSSGTACATVTRSSTCSRCRPASACTRATSRSAASPRTSRRLGQEGQASSPPTFPARLDQYADADRQQPALPRACAARTSSTERRCCDLRRDRPAAARRRQPVGPAQGRAVPRATTDFDFKIPIGTVGDNYDRYRVRVAEMRESVQDHRPGLDGLPEGAVHHRATASTRCRRAHELATSMEALIHHFKLVTEGFRVPPGEAYYPIESPARRARLLRARRRLLEAGPRAHARPLVRQPAVASAPMAMDTYVADMICSLGDARPDPRRRSTADGPIDVRARSSPLSHGSRVPGWDEAADLPQGPGGVPDARRPALPETCASGSRP